ncbi:GNAT family N-acetyltransferase [Legionella micdadei]|uniref:MazG nucleotide pyrophosphohydrolase domain-containing protein n=1 Tax=Legionella micdadei TaxID=451 RepID=A0A098GED3_LEGMI|nr:GNAT family N-acetyltransferase [Legionella micdadei]ARG98015.1 hypothetical protein B6N58_10280 [Legionella micdadei]ARG99666.1 hypothetical protein B6V88_04120 [Legionella micdadei]KTD26620.1 GNAT family acetyltransferase [Legionella micdadei]NSL19273.1 GNAT family N-acetyltransferase [Legionella micdadei]CEG60357.1 putative N-acyltransferase [Legionella micdadei]
MGYQIDLISPEKAEQLCCKIIANLPEYFGIPEANASYTSGVRTNINFAAQLDGVYIGLLSLNFPYPSNSNIYWMGVMREYQHQGIGRLLLQEASAYAVKAQAKTMTVETLSPGEKDENYLKTYQFYQKHGFSPLFNLKPTDYQWNMVYLFKQLNSPLQELIVIEREARDYGFDWPNHEMIIEQAISECEEIKEAIAGNEPKYRIQEEIGDLLHTAISLCLFAGFDPDLTLAQIVTKFTARMCSLQAIAKEQGLTTLKGQPTELMIELWNKAKRVGR